MNHHLTRRGVAGLAAALFVGGALFAAPALAQSGEPIKIGFSMALTGPLAPNGKQALLGADIWAEEINAKGGLLGRKVELIHYDDQSNPANVPGIYTKLLDIDKVDIVMGPYGTNLNAPALPVVMQKGRLFVGFFALDINSEFHYPKYFSMLPTGPKPREAFTEGFFDAAAAQNPKPKTVSLVSEDAEFAAQRLRRRAQQRQGRRLQYRLRQDVSAGHDRLLADRARATGRQRRYRRGLLISALFGRHRAIHS